MNQLEYIMYLIDNALDTSNKRHITGGVLISLSLLFGGLAATVMTIDENEGEKIERKSK